MKELQPLDPVTIALSGTKLIEASAGTGKTYAITGLYVRLLLERQLAVDNILVVTFTEAATKELRERIRNRLHDALKVYEQKNVSDPFLQALYEKHRRDGLNIKQCRERLSLALHSIDLAAISTIHSFCSRILQDSAFESSLLFDLTLCENDSELLGQIIDDYWRKNIGIWQDPFVQYLFYKKINADTLLIKMLGVVKVARVVGMGGIDFPLRLSPAHLGVSMAELSAIWTRARHEIIELLASPALSKAKNGKYHPDNVADWVGGLDEFFQDGEKTLLPVAAFEKLSTSALLAGTQPSKMGLTPEHQFFNLAEQLISQLKQASNGLYFDLLEECLKELPQQKNLAGVLSFDDLLLCVRDGLRDKEFGGALAAKIRRQYQALLIDEFQDTDAVQYEIFQTLYGNRENPLFLIGDPKQAIYRFRGADIYAYLKAVRGAGPNVYGMETNWRSEPDFVRGLNVLFGCTGENPPFFIPEIGYHKVEPAKLPAAVLSVEGDTSRALSFLSFPDQVKKGKAKQFIAKNLARQMKRLISFGKLAKASFSQPRQQNQDSTGEEKGENLLAGHMAVLVRSHKDCELVRAALAEQGIRSVLHSRRDVFESIEAREMQILLAGVLRCTDTHCLKSALATSLCGWSAAELMGLEDDDERLELTSECFVDDLRLWEAKGFAVMILTLLRREKIISRLASFRNGERRITNLRHIIEILQDVSHKESLGPAALFDWFQKQRHSGELTDERQLRLESDENLVKIVTIHKSKGLEYPIVFCPFLWDSPHFGQKESWLSWHDENGNERLDMGTDFLEERFQLQARENMAEEFRVLYVALTRARNRCVIYWGNVLAGKAPVTAKSALYHLLNSFISPKQCSEPAGAPRNSNKEEDHILGPLFQMAAYAPESMSIGPCEITLTTDDVAGEISQELRPVCTDFRTVEPSWAVLSFSSLLRLEKNSGKYPGKDGSEEPDHDGLFDHNSGGYLVPHTVNPVANQQVSKGSENAQNNYEPDALQPTVEALNSGLSGSVDFEPENSARNMFNFPRGANPGSCLHDIFEKLDFSTLGDDQSVKIVTDSLAMYGIDVAWTAPLLDGLGSILKTGLDDEHKDLCLGHIGQEQRINEMEFYYSVPGYGDAEFQTIFHGDSGSQFLENKWSAGDLAESVCYMKGFIDLIFEWQGRYYIVDYKSNHLGDHFDDYHQSRLHGEMVRAGYDMQYHIYLVALHRYLQKRIANYDYETHMGGVYYLFIRGMSPGKGPEYGVFKDRPGREIIERMDERLRCVGLREAAQGFRG